MVPALDGRPTEPQDTLHFPTSHPVTVQPVAGHDTLQTLPAQSTTQLVAPSQATLQRVSPLQ